MFLKLGKHKGIGLLEVLGVTLLIGIGVVGFIKFQNQLMYQGQSSKQMTQANTFATEKIETLRDYYTPEGYDAITSGSESKINLGTTYNIVWNVTDITGNISYKQINVIVSYIDRDGKAKNVNISTNFASKDPLNEATMMSGVGGSSF